MFKENWEKHNCMKQVGGIVNDDDDDDDDDDCRAVISRALQIPVRMR